MGMGPLIAGPLAGHNQQQQQNYMDQFNNAQYAAIPGLRGPQPILPAAPTGTFNGQPDLQMFLPQGQGYGTMQNHMLQVAPPTAMSGAYGRQATQLAGLLGRPSEGYPSGGLLGGRPRGFRIPGK